LRGYLKSAAVPAPQPPFRTLRWLPGRVWPASSRPQEAPETKPGLASPESAAVGSRTAAADPRAAMAAPSGLASLGSTAGGSRQPEELPSSTGPKAECRVAGKAAGRYGADGGAADGMDTSLAELLGGKACAEYRRGAGVKDTSLAVLSGGGGSSAVQSSRFRVDCTETP